MSNYFHILEKLPFFSINLRKRVYLILFANLIIGGIANTQSVGGQVTDENGDPIIGAVILEQSNPNNGTVTDLDGNFKITLKSLEGNLEITYVGYETLRENINGRMTINVQLRPSVSQLEEVVITGYLPTKRKDVLGAVSSIKGGEITQVSPVSAFDAMQGRMSGVQIANNGQPGEGFDITIRGNSTFSGGGGPLFVVDGQQLENINNLDPNDFASIEVLKDASTAAIYGSRAANGVVMITTKSGQIGKSVIDVSQTVTFQTVNSGIPLANTADRIFYERARQATPPITVLDSLNVLYYISNDLQKLLFQTGQRSLTNLSISGGNGGTKYFWNTGYYDHKGSVINSGYNRLNSTLKLDTEISKKVKAGSRITLTSEKRGGLNENTVFQQMVERIPYFPVFEPDGSYTVEIAGRQNPVAEALFTKRDIRNYRVQIFNNFEVKLLPFLTYKANFGGNLRLQRNDNFDPTIVQTPGNPTTGSETTFLNRDFQVENLLFFKKSIKNIHNFNGVFGYSLQKWDDENSAIAAISFVSDNIETLNNVAELNKGTTVTTRQARALTGLFGNMQYNYKNKYLFNGVLRRDGSSVFGSNKRYGLFPSFSLGWKVNNESFLKNYNDIVSNLLIRAGFGSVGNDKIGIYASELLYRPGNIYNGINGIAPFQIANSDLGWETTKTTNLAIDLGLWKGRIEMNVDLWRKETSDLLYRVPIPAETGFSSVSQNIGGIRNTGLDLNIGVTPYRNKNFSWRSDFNITFLKNIVTELADAKGFETGNSSEITYLIQEGQPLGNMYTYVNTGVFPYAESNAFSPSGEQLTPIFDDAKKFLKYQLNGSDYTGEVKNLRLSQGNRLLGAGDIIWKDLNGDFLIDANDDRMITGNGLPNKFGGWNNQFKYKGLTVNVLFDYTFGGNIFRLYDQRRNDLNSANETPSPVRMYGAWLKPGDIAEFASLDRNRIQNRLPNSAYVDKGDYIKLRNISASYTLPKRIVNSTKFIQNVSINASMNNWLTFTNYTGYNPELGSRGNALTPGLDGLRYPSTRETVLGINIKF